MRFGVPAKDLSGTSPAAKYDSARRKLAQTRVLLGIVLLLLAFSVATQLSSWKKSPVAAADASCTNMVVLNVTVPGKTDGCSMASSGSECPSGGTCVCAGMNCVCRSEAGGVTTAAVPVPSVPNLLTVSGVVMVDAGNQDCLAETCKLEKIAVCALAGHRYYALFIPSRLAEGQALNISYLKHAGCDDADYMVGTISYLLSGT